MTLPPGTFPAVGKPIRHKVFISYYHQDDQYYRYEFQVKFSHLFINKSVEPGEIETDNNTEYIKRLIQEGYISDSSIAVVLVGPNTWKRKHVDWEISAALNKKVGGYSELLGLWLPNHPDFGSPNYHADLVPPRLIDNFKSGYAMLYDWTEEMGKTINRIEEAFKNRIEKAKYIDNSREQYRSNRP